MVAIAGTLLGPDIFVEFGADRLSLTADKDGCEARVFVNGRRWIPGAIGRTYLERVWVTFLSKKQVSKAEISPEGGYGKIWCEDHEGVNVVQVAAALPQGWFQSVADMATSFTKDHCFQASFTTPETAKNDDFSFLKPKGGISTVIDFQISMWMAADTNKM